MRLVKIMKTRNKVIICVSIIGVVLFGLVQGYIIPQKSLQDQQYMVKQRSPITHDLKSILKYKNKYMGNSSNIINLFYTLPLSDLGMSFQLFPEKLMADVNYKAAVSNIDREKLSESLIYNSTAAFALIDNLEAINFNFTGTSYKVLRTDAQEWYGCKLSELVKTNDVWKLKVQDKLADNEYVDKCLKAIIN